MIGFLANLTTLMVNVIILSIFIFIFIGIRLAIQHQQVIIDKANQIGTDILKTTTDAVSGAAGAAANNAVAGAIPPGASTAQPPSSGTSNFYNRY